MKKVIFNIGYNGCVLDDGVKYKSREDELKWEEMEEEIVDRCFKLYSDDGEFIGDEDEVVRIVKDVVGECEVEFDYVGS